MPKIQTVQVVDPPEIQLTPNRRTLAEMIDHRDTALAEAQVLTERIARLDRAKAAVSPLEQQLAMLNAAESNAMLSWSEGDDGSEPPAADAAKRSELESKLAGARAAVSAADGATRSVQAQSTRVHAGLAELQPWIGQAVGLVLLDELTARLPGLRAAVDAAVAKKAEVDAAREIILSGAERLPDDVRRPIHIALEKFADAFRDAGSMPMQVDDSVARALWSGLAGELQADASATMEASK
jgi:hypothetical protein